MANAFIRKLLAYMPLSESDLRLLDAATKASKTVPAYRDLIREGDEPNMVFVVLEGWACRYKILPDGSRQIMAFMMPGDFCDPHIGSLEEMDHSVGTISPCAIASIPRRDMEQLIVATPGLTHAFWRAQLVDQGVLRSWIVSMGRRDASQRVAHLMLELYVRMRSVGLTADETCEMPLTQTVIADALGLTPIHTNRVFRSFRERSVMTLRSGKLVIMNIAELVKVAGFDELPASASNPRCLAPFAHFDAKYAHEVRAKFAPQYFLSRPNIDQSGLYLSMPT